MNCVGRGEVAEQAPPVGARAPAMAFDQAHRVGEGVHVVAGHFVA